MNEQRCPKAGSEYDAALIPVLVHGAKMPTAEQLPDELKELAFHNAVELTHARWSSDIQVLVHALRKHMESSESGNVAALARRPSRLRALAVPALVLALAGGGFFAYQTFTDGAAKAERASLQQANQEAAAAKLKAEHFD